MAELNTYQLAGLIGTTTSDLMSSANLYGKAGMMETQGTLDSSSILSQGFLSAEQTLMESDLQQILRSQEQADLLYQSQVQGIEAEILTAQADFASAQAEAKANEQLKQLNSSVADMTVRAVAQGRSGATVNNLIRQSINTAEKDMAQAKTEGELIRSNIEAQKAKAISGSKISELAIKSSKETAQLEKTVASSQAEFTKKSSQISAQSIKDQAKIASRMARSGAITGAITSLASGYASYGMIK